MTRIYSPSSSLDRYYVTDLQFFSSANHISTHESKPFCNEYKIQLDYTLFACKGFSTMIITLRAKCQLLKPPAAPLSVSIPRQLIQQSRDQGYMALKVRPYSNTPAFIFSSNPISMMSKKSFDTLDTFLN